MADRGVVDDTRRHILGGLRLALAIAQIREIIMACLEAPNGQTVLGLYKILDFLALKVKACK